MLRMKISLRERVLTAWHFGWGVPVALFLGASAAFIGAHFWITQPGAFRHVGFVPAEVMSSFPLQSDTGPQGVRYQVRLANGRVLFVSSSSGAVIGQISGTACVDLLRHRKAERFRGRLVPLQNCDLPPRP